MVTGLQNVRFRTFEPESRQYPIHPYTSLAEELGTARRFNATGLVGADAR